MTEVQAQRVLNTARAARETPNREGFRMRSYGNCGSPHCVLGNYAERADLQGAFCLMRRGHRLLLTADYRPASGLDLCVHFGLCSDEVKMLFGDQGCDDAQTPEAAADYIENFIACKRAAGLIEQATALPAAPAVVEELELVLA